MIFKDMDFNSSVQGMYVYQLTVICTTRGGMCDQQSLRSACAYAQSDQSLCLSLEHSMTVKLLTEHHLEFLSLKGGCTGSPESTLVKMSNYWKSHVAAHLSVYGARRNVW